MKHNHLIRRGAALLLSLALALTMLAGSVCPAVDRALICVASLTLEEQLLALAAAKLAHSFSISCHLWYLLVIG